jgi:hypothetical protein
MQVSGVDQAPLPPEVGLRGPAAGFVGQINDRADLSLLEAVADRGLSLLLVGPVNPAFEPERFGALRRRDNVCWVGPQPFEAPAWLSPQDGCGSRALPGQPLQPRQFPAEDTRITGRGPGRRRNQPAGHSMAGHRPHLGCHHAYGLRRPRRPPRGQTQDTQALTVTAQFRRPATRRRAGKRSATALRTCLTRYVAARRSRADVPPAKLRSG